MSGGKLTIQARQDAGPEQYTGTINYVVVTPAAQKSANGSGEGGADEWPPLPPGGLSLVDLEKRVIERALRLKGGNITQAAAYLGIPRHVLVYRIEKFGIRRDA